MLMENNSVLVLAIAFAILLVFAGFGMMSPSSYGRYGGMYGMMGGLYGGFGLMWAFGGLLMILIFVALVLFILWLAKHLTEDKRRKK